jgi:cytochrome P450
MLAQAVLMAGTDTTRNQLACSMAVFAEYPEQWALLARRSELAPRAVEESMRYLGAVWATVRFAAEDVTYRDVLFPRTIVSTALAGANRDPEVWAQPDVFDITQERGTAQMTFGSGIRFCLGAELARAELQEALSILARRMPRLSLAGPVEWKPTNFRHLGPSQTSAALRPGVTRLPVRSPTGPCADAAGALTLLSCRCPANPPPPRRTTVRPTPTRVHRGARAGRRLRGRVRRRAS